MLPVETDTEPAVPVSGAGLSSRATTAVAELLRDVRGQTTDPRPTETHLDEAIRWLYRSQDVTGVGGSASNYNLVFGWGEAYPETSGYIIPTLYDYGYRRNSSVARDRAERMARWLLEIQLDSGGFPAGDAPEKNTEPSVFNTGQILLGLARADLESDDDRFLEAARVAGHWLVEVQNGAGYWDRFDYHDTVHSYTSRVAWPLLVVAERTREPELRDAARANLSWVLDQQRENGWFEQCGFDDGEDPYLHTLAYTVRGLFEGGRLLGEDRYVEAATRTADHLLRLQNERGILHGQFDAAFRSPNFYCLTGNAQMAIVWYRLYELTGESRYQDAAVQTVEFLKTHHRLDGPPQVRGGLKGSAPIWGPYMYLRYPNWSTKFFADALLFSDRHDP